MVSGSNYNSSEAITGYHLGLTAEVKFLMLAVQPELIYSTQGATYKNAVSEFKNELGYLSLPVLVKVYVIPGLSVDLGPQASVLLSEKNKFDYKNSKTFDFSALIGASYNITSKLFVQARYGLGLTDMSKDAKVKNSTAQLSVGYAIW
jgi:opacity protein-like surface antigen